MKKQTNTKPTGLKKPSPPPGPPKINDCERCHINKCSGIMKRSCYGGFYGEDMVESFLLKQRAKEHFDESLDSLIKPPRKSKKVMADLDGTIKMMLKVICSSLGLPYSLVKQDYRRHRPWNFPLPVNPHPRSQKGNRKNLGTQNGGL